MSSNSNIVDLTLSSDDDTNIRDRNGARRYARPAENVVRTRVIPQQYRDSTTNSSTHFSVTGSIYRQHPVVQHHREIERRQVPALLPQHAATFQSHAVHPREGRKSPYTTVRSTTTSTAISPRPQARACVNCTEVNVTCDGEHPCSACVEPGLTCYYPGEKSTVPASVKNSTQTRIRPKPVVKQSDSVSNLLLNVKHTKLDPDVANIANNEEEAFIDSEDSEDYEVPLAITELEDVMSLLKKHEARMRDHRAYLLQPLLSQSRLDASKSPRPDLTKRQRNPFSTLVTKSRSTTGGQVGKTSLLQLQTKSHRAGAAKKWTQITVQLKVVNTHPSILPKYKSIGRLGTSLLAPNIRTLKYWPYFPDEENLDPSEAKKNEELEERYQHDDNHLLAQRKCSELVDIWQPWVKDFVSRLRIEFSDILYWFLHTDEKTICETCERGIVVGSFSEVSRLLAKPTERSLSLARLSALALKDVAKVSMWHFVLAAPSVKDLMKQIEPLKKSAASLCSVCFLHNCLSHGAYQEPEESGGAVIMGGNVEINDEEPNHNVRLAAAVPNMSHEGVHQCGLYCVAAEVRLKDILGRRKDGTCGGIHNHTIHVPRPTVKNDVSCSENCYWPVEKRNKFGTVLQAKEYEPKLPDHSKALFKKLLRIYSDNQRAPCMLSRDIDGLQCLDAFYYLLSETQRASHYRQVMAIAVQQGTRKISKIAAGLDTSLSADLDERPPFVPCHHTGSCLNNPDCTCALNKVHCEWFCGCDKTCERRFPGCKCASVSKSCFNEKNCECWKHNRECDPWLCGTCGVVEVLDPQNKYNDEIRRGRCKNNRLQLELPARTVKAPSEVQGWGLYAGSDLEEQAFIGEYKGETVGNQESDRRGAVYANIGQEYLFVMNRDQQIDGSNFGNKTRFINNSQRDDYINVFAKKLLCNGVQRVMLYAKKPIRAGEELLYNYNYPISVTKKFWERGEGPMSVPGAVAAKPSITWTQPRVNGRFARVASKQDGEQAVVARSVTSQTGGADEDESAARREAKRKRASGLIEPELAITGTVATKHAGSKILAGTLPFPDDINDSDFEDVEPSESSESVDEVEVDSDQGETTTTVGRKLVHRRTVHPEDRRRGGLAQAKAWATRRKRTTKGK